MLVPFDLLHERQRMAHGRLNTAMQ